MTTKNSERSPEVIAQQELAILEAVNSGEPVSFTTERTNRGVGGAPLQNTSGKTVYEITGADGHHAHRVRAGASENRTPWPARPTTTPRFPNTCATRWTRSSSAAS